MGAGSRAGGNWGGSVLGDQAGSIGVVRIYNCGGFGVVDAREVVGSWGGGRCRAEDASSGARRARKGGAEQSGGVWRVGRARGARLS